MTINRLILPFLLVIAGVGVASLVETETWDGGFPQVEYRVHFMDQTQHPVKGVKLKVIDNRGNISFGYPVTDFREASVPTSGEDGAMVFHHVDLSPEFGGSCRKLFFLFPIGKCGPPQYNLQFLLLNRVIASFPYSDYLGTRPNWDSLPTVKRGWEEKSHSPPSLPEHLRTENRSLPPSLEYYIIKRTIIVPFSPHLEAIRKEIP
jgi:hypothetical protein